MFLLQEIDVKMEKQNKTLEWGPTSPFEFDDKNTSLNLAFPDKFIVSGWRMKHLNADKV